MRSLVDPTLAAFIAVMRSLAVSHLLSQIQIVTILGIDLSMNLGGFSYPTIF